MFIISDFSAFFLQNTGLFDLFGPLKILHSNQYSLFSWEITSRNRIPRPSWLIDPHHLSRWHSAASSLPSLFPSSLPTLTPATGDRHPSSTHVFQPDKLCKSWWRRCIRGERPRVCSPISVPCPDSRGTNKWSPGGGWGARGTSWYSST